MTSPYIVCCSYISNDTKNNGLNFVSADILIHFAYTFYVQWYSKYSKCTLLCRLCIYYSYSF